MDNRKFLLMVQNVRSGNITYGGIISFVSRKNNFAGIDLPKSGTFISYSFLEDCTETIR